jgi:hypothetical protein
VLYFENNQNKNWIEIIDLKSVIMLVYNDKKNHLHFQEIIIPPKIQEEKLKDEELIFLVSNEVFLVAINRRGNKYPWIRLLLQNTKNHLSFLLCKIEDVFSYIFLSN